MIQSIHRESVESNVLVGMPAFEGSSQAHRVHETNVHYAGEYESVKSLYRRDPFILTVQEEADRLRNGHPDRQNECHHCNVLAGHLRGLDFRFRLEVLISGSLS